MSDTMEKQTRQSTGPESNNKRQRKATNGNNSPSLSQVARARADANLDGASLTVPLLSTHQLSGDDDAQASLLEAPTNNVVNQSSSDPNISSGLGVEVAVNGLTITVNGLAEKTNAQNNLLVDYNARLGRIEEIVRDQSNGQVGQVNGEDGEDAPAEVALPPLPIKKISQLKQFSDDSAANPRMVELLTDFIRKVGGKKAQGRVRDAMDDIFSKRLGKKYNWNGYKGGKKFEALAISKILRKAFVDAKSCSSSAEGKTHITATPRVVPQSWTTL
ncbi:hypothetical protein QAD02_016411 [Eretmocerus hayati]|uniref:Uncharacterized protein n=1 Tax=Eretmocerus hayati TaxID=131215 RepID=A0ACC2PBE9_9HYME|nr:hypothetical protein QAD02_016411 [Eretmocerus hayati]